MRRRFGQGLRIGVSGAAIALVKTSRWGGQRAVVVAEHALAQGAGAQQVAYALRAVLADGSWSRWPACVIVADDLARLWQVTPPAGAARMADLEAAAALRFQQLYGEPASGWQIAGSWDPARPFAAAAMPRALHDALSLVAAEHTLSLVNIVPQFIAGWNRWCGLVAADAWYGLVHDGVLTFGIPDGAGLGAARASQVPAGADASWLGAHAAREALRLGVAAPARLQLSGQVPDNWRGDAVQVLDDTGAGWSAAAALAATGSRA
ncbi:hypothetical protein [Massilia soli]|uniref:Uncharacterized protein n=1 Tax=Massilia soli TaxID=2792854 RepID=A0ABS7SMC8_9BURK|nr:hypothetical protein [Massilia soli]MBZ2206852.1 hypothetical protein [Massilia soli]